MFAPDPRVRIARRARRDLAGIRAYTVVNWGEDQADEYMRRLAEAFDSIAQFPEIGQTCPEMGQRYRCLAAEHHRIIYRVTGDAVFVQRVVHQRQRFTEITTLN
jgi:toxin ParE1/3/4